MNNLNTTDIPSLTAHFDSLTESEILEIPRQQFLNSSEPELIPPLRTKKHFNIFQQVQYLHCDIARSFDFFSDSKNLEVITPDLLNFKILSQSTDTVQAGSEIIYRLKLRGIPMKWKTIITNWNPPQQFVDYQESGPYQVWHHTHTFIAHGKNTILLDEVKFILPFGALGSFLAGNFVKNDVSKIFDYRYNKIKEILE